MYRNLNCASNFLFLIAVKCFLFWRGHLINVFFLFLCLLLFLIHVSIVVKAQYLDR